MENKEQRLVEMEVMEEVCDLVSHQGGVHYELNNGKLFSFLAKVKLTLEELKG